MTKKAKHRLNGVRLRAATIRAARPGEPARHVSHSAENAVALTFDDGPSEANTARVLDLLAEHGARGTFFVTGQAVAGREELLRRVVREGHELANHTFGHRKPSELTDDALRDELAWTNDVVELACGVTPRLARPPYGKDSRRFTRVAAGLGLTTVLWSVDSGDTCGYSSEAVARFIGSARGGDIVLLHDGGDRRLSTLAGLERALDTFARAGVLLTTVSDLLRVPVAAA